MIVVVTGGRDFADYEHVKTVLDAIHQQRPIARLAHGCASGADELADRWARLAGVYSTPYPANWEKYGRSAGPRRNRYMLDDAKPDLLIAFPGGRGTNDCVQAARDRSLAILDRRGDKD